MIISEFNGVIKSYNPYYIDVICKQPHYTVYINKSMYDGVWPRPHTLIYNDGEYLLIHIDTVINYMAIGIDDLLNLDPNYIVGGNKRLIAFMREYHNRLLDMYPYGTYQASISKIKGCIHSRLYYFAALCVAILLNSYECGSISSGYHLTGKWYDDYQQFISNEPDLKKLNTWVDKLESEDVIAWFNIAKRDSRLYDDLSDVMKDVM